MRKFLQAGLAVLFMSVAGWAIAENGTGPKPDNVDITTVDLTSKLVNPNFDDGSNGWTVGAGKIEVKAASTGNPVITAYGYQVNVSQKVTGLEPGKYVVKVQACSRYKDGKAGIDDYEARKAAGQEIPNEAYLYANGEQVKVKNIWDETSSYDFAKESGQAAENLTLSSGEQIPYNSTNFANAFGKLNMYENEVECVVGANGELTLGIKNELSGDGYQPYVAYDNFRLYKVTEVEEYTSQVVNPNFNDGQNGWTVTTGKIEVKAASTGNPVVTAYGYQVNISQKVTGLKPGQYVVKVQACSRYKDGKAGIEDYEARKAAGQEIPNEAYVFANGQQAKVVNIWDETSTYDFAKESGQAAENLTLSSGEQIPYNSTNFANAFGKLDMYWNEVSCTVGQNGELTLGIKNELSGDGYQPYVAYDNFHIYRVGELIGDEPGDEPGEEPGEEPGDEPSDDDLDMSKLIDMTEKLVNPNFDDKDNGWTVNTGKIEVKAASTGNPVITAYDYQVDICQTITGLEPGKYVVMVQACSRHMMGQAGIQDYENKKAKGQEIQNEAYVYANGEQKKVKNIYDEGADYDFAGESGQKVEDLRLSNGKQIPYNSTNFANAFGKFGMYENYVICSVGANGVLNLGIKNELQKSGDIIPYIAYDNFRLYKMIEEEDCTDKLVNPNFNDGQNGWTINEGKIEVKAASTGNPVVTAYNYQVDISQTVEGLTPGKYVVKVQACSRYMDKKAGIDDYEARKAEGKEIPNEAYVYANGAEKKIVNIYDETNAFDFAGESGQAASDLTMSNGGQIPYNSNNFARAFGEFGMYENQLECVVGQNGVLVLGIKNLLKGGDGIVPYMAYDNFRLYRVGDAEEDGPAFELYDLKANAGDFVAVCMPYPVKSEYFGQVYKIAEIQNGQAVLVATDAVATGEPCVIKASGENNIKEGDVTITYNNPKATVSMWDNTMMQGDLNKLTWTATAVDGSDIDVANLTYSEADLANMNFTCTIENNAAARFWAQNPDYMAETPTVIGKYLNLPAYNRTDQPNPVAIPVVAAEKDQFISYSLSEDMLMAEKLIVPAGKSVVELYNLLPGLTYYYKTADGKSAGQFTVGGTLRMIMIGKNVVNMRDLGGKKTVDGRYVKYGKLFRNAEFKGNTFNITDDELQKLLALSIGAELDLRNEDGNKPWLPNAVRDDNFYWAQGKNYIANGPGKMYDETAKTHIKAEFELIVNNLRKGVAVDFHCRIGADRTGFLAFLLEGLLGVSETDLLLDYETTSFSEAGLRTKADGDGDAAASSYEKVIPAEFRGKIPEGGTLRDAFEDYFVNTLGVEKELIDEYRNIMLGDSPIADVQDEQDSKLIALLQQEIDNSKLYVYGDDFGQYKLNDQALVDDYQKAAAAANIFLTMSDGLVTENIKAQLKTLCAARDAMLEANPLNMPKAGDLICFVSKSYGKYVVPRSTTNWTVNATLSDKCAFNFDGQNIINYYNGLTFGYDAKKGLATAVKEADEHLPVSIVPSVNGTVGCYNLKIGDYILINQKNGGTNMLEARLEPNEDADMILERYDIGTSIRGIDQSDKASATFNLSGQKVDGSYKGIVIRGGKKMVVK